MSSQRDLKVQALHELGNLHFYAGNKRYIVTGLKKSTVSFFFNFQSYTSQLSHKFLCCPLVPSSNLLLAVF